MIDVSLRSTVLPLSPADLGRICWQVDDDTWRWAPSVYALHGYPVGGVRPTTAVMLAHKHPEDANRCVDEIHAGILRQQPIVSEHRIVDLTGVTRPVLLLGRAESGCPDPRRLPGYLLALDGPTPAAVDDIWVDDPVGRACLNVMATFGLSFAAARTAVSWHSAVCGVYPAVVAASVLNAGPVDRRRDGRARLAERLFPHSGF